MQHMSPQSFRLSIIIPTKNRLQALTQLLESISRLAELDTIRPQVIVADNDSADNTCLAVSSMAKTFPTQIQVLKVARPGKSAAINDAVQSASGAILAFLDDDVVVDKTWLAAVRDFFRNEEYQVGQGVIRLAAPENHDPEVLRLVERYRTIPRLEHQPNLKTLHSLNGANFFVSRDVFDRVGGFDERLGPGASGTSEDVDFAHRLGRAGIAIGYAPRAVVYHRVDRHRLTEEYFKASHRRQGASRFLIRRHSSATICLNLVRAAAQYGFYTASGRERERYRSKGRIYHYLGMLAARQNHSDRRPADKTEDAMEAPSLRR